MAATGNDGSTAPAYPAGDRGVIGVTSTNRDDRLAPGSNSGPAAFMAAPGVDILTTDAGGGYEAVSGTSAAAAEVAGAAGLLRALDPGASNGVIVGRLARSAAPAEHAGPDRERAPRPRPGGGRYGTTRSSSRRASRGPRTAVRSSGRTWRRPCGPGPARGGDNNWTTAANWGGTAPVAGDDLVFPAGAARLSNTNNYAQRDGVQLDHDLRDGLHPGRQPGRARRGRPDLERRRLGEHAQPAAVVRRDRAR